MLLAVAQNSTRPCAPLTRHCAPALAFQAPKHAWHHTEAAVEGSFGAPISELFESFEAEPVASGSIAQVGAARSNPGARWLLCLGVE